VADHTPVPDSVLEEPDHPFVVDGVEKPTNVCIEHPAHLSPLDPDRQGVQRVVLAASRPESVGETDEVLLVDGVQHLDRRSLDDLVLQRWHADRARSAIRLRDLYPPDGTRSIRSALQPRGQILKVGLEFLSVGLPRRPVDPRGPLPIQGAVRLFQATDVVNVVPERSEPLPPIPARSLPYP
jgi:hypothetical protein